MQSFYPHPMALSRCLISGSILILAVCWLCALPAAANPPSEMSISINDLSHELVVTITHPVPDPRVHYIKEIQVKVNGMVANNSHYTSQPSQETFTYTYPLSARPGDEISVTASCVIGGSLGREMIMPGATATTPTATATQKAAAGIAPVLGLVILIVSRKV